MQCQCPSVRTISFIVAGLNVLGSALVTIRVIVHLAVYNHIETQIAKSDKGNTSKCRDNMVKFWKFPISTRIYSGERRISIGIFHITVHADNCSDMVCIFSIAG